jgi:cell pole-organizing protein PopZ
MSDPTAQEPTMEEILASIRRIISEDDAPPAAEAAHESAPAPAAPPPAPPVVHAAPEPEPAYEEEDDDVLELNEPAPAPRETHGDLDVFEAPRAMEAKPEPKVEMAQIKMADPEPAPTYAPPVSRDYGDPEPAGGGLVSGQASAAAASHFGALAQSIAMPAHGRTLEDVVSELLKPLLKDWLDQHLPTMVEQAVRDEVERISRRRVY